MHRPRPIPATRILAVLAMALVAAAGPAAAAWDARNPVRPVVDAADPARILVRFELPAFTLTPADVDGTTVTVVDLPGVELRREAGLPELPMLTASLALPADGKVRLEIVGISEHTVAVAPVIPSLGHLSRNADPADAVRTFAPLYADGGAWPEAAVELGRPFLVGTQRGVTLRLQPLRYDAGRGVLTVTDRIEIAVVSEGTGGINPAPAGGARSPLGERLFVNAPLADDAKSFTTGDRPGRMLIVVADAFADAVAPLAQWKTRRGIEVEVATVSSLGGTSAGIAAGIAQRWSTQGIDWVLLAGDREWVPTRTGTYDGSDSDTRYALVSGDDLMPDLFVSRIPARTSADLAQQVAKFIAYERDAAPTGATGYTRAAGIASNEGTPADDVRCDNLRADLLATGFTGVDQLYQRTGATAADVRAAVLEGRSLINYIGHGTGTAWTSVPFSVTDVTALNNSRWPWIVDVSCSNGEFARTTCLAEAWMRAGTAAAPAGAVAVVAASSVAPWTPPTVMQSEIVDLLAYGQERTIGALHMAGLVRVLDVYGGLSVATQVLEQFNLFGDASLQVRTRAPGVFMVDAPGAVAPDAGFTVSTKTAGAVVAVSAGATLYGYGRSGADGAAQVACAATPPAR
ncbi:MAG TPA: C25 family cysteine peptidase, partial [Candidatus Krumholzibacteria bacterium]|nr:C25 family cysteine peptidase [Candidatus Krumholzibacteria bacterium]